MTDDRAPREGPDRLGGRLPLVDPAQLSPAQQLVYDRLVEHVVPAARADGILVRLDDGRFVGPFNGFLHAPELGRGLMGWSGAQLAHSGLSPEVREVVILTVGAAWQAPYEIYAHEGAARRAGVSDADVEAIIAGGAPSAVSDEARVAHQVTASLVRDHVLADALHAEAVALLGIERLLGVIHLAGQYMTISALLVAAAVPAPDSRE